MPPVAPDRGAGRAAVRSADRQCRPDLPDRAVRRVVARIRRPLAPCTSSPTGRPRPPAGRADRLRSATAVPLSLGLVEQSLTLLIPREIERKGTRVPGDRRKLVLDEDDSATRTRDLIEIGNTLVAVTAIATEDGKRIASFASDLPDQFTKYLCLRRSNPKTIAARDRGTLVRLSGADLPKNITAIRFLAPAAPARRPSRAQARPRPARHGCVWARSGPRRPTRRRCSCPA